MFLFSKQIQKKKKELYLKFNSATKTTLINKMKFIKDEGKSGGFSFQTHVACKVKKKTHKKQTESHVKELHLQHYGILID